MTGMKKIIFVDDEPRILQGIKRMLRDKRKQWDMVFIENGMEALERLGQEPFDVLVTDMRMPLLDGAALLEKARQLSPSTVRIVLSGHSEKSSIMRSVRQAHQYLSKPVEKEQLEEAVENALNLHGLLADQGLAELLTQVDSLPALPEFFERLMEEIESEDCSLEKVGRLISSDMGMSATILKLVNSCFFGLPRKVADPSQAVALLGLDTVKALVLSYQLFSVQGQGKLPSISLEQLWVHSLNTGGFAKAIAQCEGWGSQEVDEAFLAGILHDVGKLTLITASPERYGEVVRKVRQGEGLIHQVERELMGASHSEAGAYLMGLWGFSAQVLQAIGLHHLPVPSAKKTIDLLTVIHVSNVLEHRLVVIHPDYAKPEPEMAYLEEVGASGRLEAWQKTCKKVLP